MTVRPALERSSATTLWIRAHCSLCAPGGVSQRICQSPWTERTAPWAAAGVVNPNQQSAARPAAIAPAERRLEKRRRRFRQEAELAGYFEGPIGVDPLIFLRLISWQTVLSRVIRQSRRLEGRSGAAG